MDGECGVEEARCFRHAQAGSGTGVLVPENEAEAGAEAGVALRRWRQMTRRPGGRVCGVRRAVQRREAWSVECGARCVLRAACCVMYDDGGRRTSSRPSGESESRAMCGLETGI